MRPLKAGLVIQNSAARGHWKSSQPRSAQRAVTPPYHAGRWTSGHAVTASFLHQQPTHRSSHKHAPGLSHPCRASPDLSATRIGRVQARIGPPGKTSHDTSPTLAQPFPVVWALAGEDRRRCVGVCDMRPGRAPRNVVLRVATELPHLSRLWCDAEAQNQESAMCGASSY